MRAEVSQQADLFRHSPPFLAAAYREAAQTERFNPYYPPNERERRAAEYLAEAERLERANEQ